MATPSFQLLRPCVWKWYLNHLIFSYSTSSRMEPVGPIFKIDRVGDHISPPSLLQPWCDPVHISRDWYIQPSEWFPRSHHCSLFSTQQTVLACRVFVDSCLRVQDRVLTYDMPPHHPHLLCSLPSSTPSTQPASYSKPGSLTLFRGSLPFVSIVKYLLSHPLSLAIPAKSLLCFLFHLDTHCFLIYYIILLTYFVYCLSTYIRR